MEVEDIKISGNFDKSLFFVENFFPVEQEKE
jgi:hypothetical protein